MKQRLRQVIAQKQYLSPRVLAMLGTFQMSMAALEDWLASEGEKNIMLSIQKPTVSVSSDYEAPITRNPDQTLQSVLLSQLDHQPLSDQDRAIGIALIDGIQPDGYLEATVYAHIRDTYSVTDQAINQVLDIIHTFEPNGVGARSLQECLLIQLAQNPSDSVELDDLLRTVITDHIHKFYELTPDILNLTVAQTDALKHYIATHFHPKPGLQYPSHGDNQPVLIPSFYIDYSGDDSQIINLEKDNRIHIGIASEYVDLLNSDTTPPETKAFLQDLYDKAVYIIDQVTARWERLHQIVSHIATVQRPFLTKQSTYLKPLQQDNLASLVSVSVSTISRLVNAKSIETKHGVYSLKALCPRSYFGKTKDHLKAIITEYCQLYPRYSDQQLARLLATELGMRIARRTVASYRNQLGIPSGYTRPSISPHSGRS